MTTSNASSKLGIIDFSDYRGFLKHRYLQIKKKNPKYNYRYMAKRAKVADNYFKNIFDCKKNLSLDRLTSAAEILELSEEEKTFLLFKLIHTSTSEPVASYFFEYVLEVLKFGLVPAHRFERTFQRHDWLFRAIYMLAGFADFKPDSDWLRNKLVYFLPQSEEQIEAVFYNVLNSGMLEQNKSGKYIQKDVFVQHHGFDQVTASDFCIEMQKYYSDFCRDSGKHDFFTAAATIVAVNGAKDHLKIKEAYLEYLKELKDISRSTNEPDLLLNAYAAVFAVTKHPRYPQS